MKRVILMFVVCVLVSVLVNCVDVDGYEDTRTYAPRMAPGDDLRWTFERVDDRLRTLESAVAALKIGNHPSDKAALERRIETLETTAVTLDLNMLNLDRKVSDLSSYVELVQMDLAKHLD